MAFKLDRPVKFGQFLSARGFKSAAEFEAFRDADLKSLPLPETMPGMERAVALLLEARRAGRPVGVVGDYDVDGLTAAALLKRVLEGLGFVVVVRIPHRLEEGYGLSVKAVTDLAARGVGLLITVDCGVSDVEAVAEAVRLGLEVVVTDHHRLPPELPKAAAILNPHLGGGWEERPLAGVGVAFMLAWAVRQACLNAGLCREAPSLVENLALVALGTIADLAPLTGPNRTLVRHGLAFLMAARWPGLQALKKALKLDGQRNISVRDVGFKLAPRLNAAGRLGSADPALEVLVTADKAQAEALVKLLEDLNTRRYATQQSLVEEALEQLECDVAPDSATVVLAGEGWPRGLLGLAASRVAERSGKPTIMFSLEGDLAVGSGRTARGFNLFAALDKIRRHCLHLGGHAQAAGLKIQASALQAFKDAFEAEAVEATWDEVDKELLVDFEVGPSDLPLLLGPLTELEPYGQGNPPPVAVMRGLKVLDASAGAGRGDRLMMRVSDGLKSLNLSGFNLVSRLEEVEPVMDVAVMFDSGSGGYPPSWRLWDFKPPQEGGFH
ncbi:MAG: single-stranded-DNA-specific exonuclease RecJ [Deltaproteobacteria bacterium]|nr:single-stranded-DNA-specific exonuclease RecJ [Deltaproteobacteria bacterium]